MPQILRHLALSGLLMTSSVSALAEPAAADEADRTLYRAVDVAREMMNSKDIYDRILAAGALSDLGDTQALVLLERCIEVDDIVIQRSAIDTLITTSHPNSVNLLFKSASRDPDVLGLMAESLASIPRDDMGDLLVEALGPDSTDFVKKHALQALVHALEREKRGRFTIETVDEQPVGRYPLLGLLREAGFSRVPKGLSWYG